MLLFYATEDCQIRRHPDSVVITRWRVDAVASNCKYVSRLERDC